MGVCTPPSREASLVTPFGRVTKVEALDVFLHDSEPDFEEAARLTSVSDAVRLP